MHSCIEDVWYVHHDGSPSPFPPKTKNKQVWLEGGGSTTTAATRPGSKRGRPGSAASTTGGTNAFPWAVPLPAPVNGSGSDGSSGDGDAMEGVEGGETTAVVGFFATCRALLEATLRCALPAASLEGVDKGAGPAATAYPAAAFADAGAARECWRCVCLCFALHALLLHPIPKKWRPTDLVYIHEQRCGPLCAPGPRQAPAAAPAAAGRRRGGRCSRHHAQVAPRGPALAERALVRRQSRLYMPYQHMYSLTPHLPPPPPTHTHTHSTNIATGLGGSDSSSTATTGTATAPPRHELLVAAYRFFDAALSLSLPGGGGAVAEADERRRVVLLMVRGKVFGGYVKQTATTND